MKKSLKERKGKKSMIRHIHTIKHFNRMFRYITKTPQNPTISLELSLVTRLPLKSETLKIKEKKILILAIQS